MTGTYTEEIVAIIHRAEAEAYARGKADAKREMLQHLTMADPDIAGVDEVTVTMNVTEDTGLDISKSEASVDMDGRVRAPKGTVGQLVRHALRVSPGLTPAEILHHARDDAERMVKAASVRAELNAGKGRGDYHSKDGKWFLSDSDAEGQTVQAEPSASSQGTEGGDPDAAALI